MREMLPELEEIELPDEGHWIMAEARDEVTGAVLKWMAKSAAAVVKGKL
jgi:dipeptidyl aminopeptidase/acylaminoacyl peptidase